MNRSCQNRLWLLLRINTMRAALAEFKNKKLNSPKVKRRKADKKSARNGKVTKARQAA